MTQKEQRSQEEADAARSRRPGICVAVASGRWGEMVTFAILVAGILLVYLTTASYTHRQNHDSRAAALGAWSLGTRGTVALPEDWAAEDISWSYVGPDGRSYVDRFPGPILWGAAFYAATNVAAPRDVPSHPDLIDFRPAGVAAASASAIAVGVSYLGFRRIVSRRRAVLAALVLAFGTSVWSISADALWTHGVTHLGLASGILLAAARRPAWAGLGFAVAILARPHTAIAPFVLGVGRTLRGERFSSLLGAGAIPLVAAALLAVYAKLVFGAWLPAASYSSVDLGAGMATTPIELGRRLIGALVDPRRGLLVYAPFLVVLMVGIRPAWRKAPDWVRDSAIAGSIYLLVQLQLNRFSGGDVFFAYRLPIESVVLAAPLLVLCYMHAVRGRRPQEVLLAIAVSIAIAFQFVGATFRSPEAYHRIVEELSSAREPGHRLDV